MVFITHNFRHNYFCTARMFDMKSVRNNNDGKQVRASIIILLFFYCPSRSCVESGAQANGQLKINFSSPQSILIGVIIGANDVTEQQQLKCEIKYHFLATLYIARFRAYDTVRTVYAQFHHLSEMSRLNIVHVILKFTFRSCMHGKKQLKTQCVD